MRGNKLAVGIREAAGMVGISPRSLQNFIATKRIPARKLGRRTVVLVRDLVRFLRHDQPSASPPPRKKAVDAGGDGR